AATMMSMSPANGENTSLSPPQCVRRVIAVAALGTTLLLMRAIDPIIAGAWLPFHPSCGAITGLPCIFCGMTRALHFLLNGDFDRALYFNWLAFPLSAAIICFAVLFTVEIAWQRKLFYFQRAASISPSRVV